MASRLSWLTTCKLSQLKTIATATGIHNSGTKPVLTSRLLAELPHSKLAPNNDNPKNGGSKKTEPKNRRSIISIDMGIRNLAYCRLVLPSSPTAKPTLTHWTRIAISRKQASSTPAPAPAAPEAFDPQTYAAHAYALVTRALLPLQPSQILIERQRFRSMGGSSVQEWTLRVNMFEAMLYAVLKTVGEQGVWAGRVDPVAPAKVANFWVGEGAEEEGGKGVDGTGKKKKRGGAKKGAETKSVKIGLVAQWLRDGNVIALQGQAQDMAKAYMAKNEGGRKVMIKSTPVLLTHDNTAVPDEKKSEEELGKLDDLADCLLQGMAWWTWEGNRRRVVERGFEVLDEM